LVNFSLPLSDDSISSMVEALTSLSRKSKVTSGFRSDGLGSSIESPPLLVIVRVVVSDSQSILVSTNMFMPEEGSVLGHS